MNGSLMTKMKGQ